MTPAEGYAPIAELSDAERSWATQLAGRAWLTLGWQVVGRDPDGHLVAATTLACGRDTQHERYCTATLTPAGIVHRTLRRSRANPQTPPEAPQAP